jgi:hypothetical protein
VVKFLSSLETDQRFSTQEGSSPWMTLFRRLELSLLMLSTLEIFKSTKELVTLLLNGSLFSMMWMMTNSMEILVKMMKNSL